MKTNISSVTLELSQQGLSFLTDSVNAKYFMDIMSNIRAPFTECEDGIGSITLYGPTVVFHIFELAHRWNVTPEDVLCIMFDLEQNNLLKYTLSENEFAIEPAISFYTTSDGVEHKGVVCNTHPEDLCFDKMSIDQIIEYIDYSNSLITISFPMVSLMKFSLGNDENEA